MSAGAARAMWLVGGLLASGTWLPGAATPPLARAAAPAFGATRLLYGERLDLNREPAEALAVLPGIGPSRAEAIVAGRPHCSLVDLDRIPGIGPATLARLAGAAGFPALPPNCESQMRAKTH